MRGGVGRKSFSAALALILTFHWLAQPWAQASALPKRSVPAAASSIAWPSSEAHPFLGDVRLSSAHGRLVEVHEGAPASPRRPTVFLIQDAHGVHGAQSNAAAALEALLAGGAPLPVLQEGGSGPVDTDWLAAFPFEDIKRKVAAECFKAGKLTGEEYAALVRRPGEVRLIGLEDEGLYRRNLACRRQTAGARREALRHVEACRAKLEERKARTFGPAAREADRRLAALEDAEEFLPALRAAAELVPSALAGLPNARAALRAAALEDSHSPAALEAERARLFEALARELSAEELQALAARALDVRLGRSSPRRLYEAVLSRAEALGVVPGAALRAYAEALALAESVDHEELAAEAERLKTALRDSSFSGKDRELAELDRRLRLEKDFWDLRLPPDRYALYRRLGPADWEAVESFLAAPASRGAAWRDKRLDVQNYYELALQRDAALGRRLLEELGKHAELPRAALIAGGFHTPGLTRVLRKAGLRYAVFQPRLHEGRRADGVREPNRLSAAPGAPLAGSLPKEIALRMSAEAAVEKIVRELGRAEDGRPLSELNAEELKRWWEAGRDRVAIRLKSALAAEQNGAAKVVLHGRVDGRLVVMVFDPAGELALLIDEDAGLDGRSLDERLRPLLEPGGPLEGLRDLWDILAPRLAALSGAKSRDAGADELDRLRRAAEEPIERLASAGAGWLVRPLPQALSEEARLGAGVVKSVRRGFWGHPRLRKALIYFLTGWQTLFSLGALPAKGQTPSLNPPGLTRPLVDSVTLEQVLASLDQSTAAQISAEALRRNRKFREMMGKKLFVDLVAGYRLAPGRLPRAFTDPVTGALPAQGPAGEDVLLRQFGGSLLTPEAVGALRRWNASRRDPLFVSPGAGTTPFRKPFDAGAAGVPADGGKGPGLPLFSGGPRTDLGLHRYRQSPITPANLSVLDTIGSLGRPAASVSALPLDPNVLKDPFYIVNQRTKASLLSNPAVQSWLAGGAAQLLAGPGGTTLRIYSDANGNGRMDPGEEAPGPASFSPVELAQFVSALTATEGVRLFLEDSTVVFNVGGRKTRVDLVRLAGTPDGMQASLVLAFYAGLALHSTANPDGTVTLNLADPSGRAIGPAQTVELNDYLKLQVAVSELEGARMFLNGRTAVFTNAAGQAFTRLDLLAMGGSPLAQAVFGWHAGLALRSTLNPDGTVTLRLSDGRTPPARVDLNEFLTLMTRISELSGAKLFLDDKELVFRNAAGREFTRLDLLTLAGTPGGAEAAVVLGWYAGLAVNSTVSGATVTLRLLDEQGRPVTPPATVDMNAFLRAQVAISRLDGAKLFLDGTTVVFRNAQGREFTRFDLLTAAQAPGGAEAALVLGWYAGLAVNARVNADGTVTLRLSDPSGRPLGTPATVNLNTFLKAQVAISQLPGARLFLEGTQVVFRNAQGREFTRLDLLALAATPEGREASAVLGWYAGLALHAELKPDGAVAWSLVNSSGRPVAAPRSVDLDEFLRLQVAISQLPGARLFLEGGEIVYRDGNGREFTRLDLVTVATAAGDAGAEAAAVLAWYAGLAARSTLNADGTVTLVLLDENGKPVKTPLTTDLDTLLRIQAAVSGLEGARLFLEDRTVVFRNAQGREFTRVDLLTLAGAKTPEGAQASAVLAWYAGLALQSTVNADGTVTLRLSDAEGRPIGSPRTVDLDVFLRTQAAISELPGARLFVSGGTVVYRNAAGQEFTRLDLLQLAATRDGATASAILGWYAGLALQSTLNEDGSVTLRLRDADGKPVTPPQTVDLDTFLRTQAAISELPGTRAFLDGTTVVFRNAAGQEFTRVDLLRLAGTSRGAEAAAVLGWHAGLAQQTTVNADGTVTLRLFNADGTPVAPPQTVDLDAFLRSQAAISQLQGSRVFLEGGAVVYVNSRGREFTRFDLVKLANQRTPAGMEAAAILGWYAGLATNASVNADGTVTLRLFNGGEPVGQPQTVDLDAYLRTQVAISELGGARLFLDDKFVVFRDADGRNRTRVDLLALAAAPGGMKAAAILGWYTGLAMNSTVNPDGSVTLRLLNAEGTPVTPPQTVDLDAFLRTQVAISELPGARIFLDDKAVVFQDRDGRNYSRVDLLALAGTPEGVRAGAILGWYAGLALQSRLDGTRVTLVLTDAQGRPVTPAAEVNLDTFLRTQAAVSQLYGARLFLDDRFVVFADANGREYTRVDLVALSALRGPDGRPVPDAVIAGAVLGWYAGLALRTVATPQGVVVQLYRDNNKNGRFDDMSEAVAPPAEIDLGRFLAQQTMVSQSPAAVRLLSNEAFRQLLAQSADASLSEQDRRNAAVALQALSSFASRGRLDAEGRAWTDLSGRQAETIKLNDFLLLQDFIVGTASFQRLIDPRAAPALRGMNVLQLMDAAGSETADPLIRAEAQRVLGIAGFFAGLAARTVDTDGDGLADDVVLRLSARQGGDAVSRNLGARPDEMLMKDFLDAYAAVLDLDNFRRVINEGGDLTFTDRQGNRVALPREAMLASVFFANYGTVTSGAFFELFGLGDLRVDRDGDGTNEDAAVTRFDLLTLPDERLRAVNAVAVFLAVNRQDLESETGLAVGEILRRITRAMPDYRDYARQGFRRDVELTEGDFFFLLYLQREASARGTTIEHLLFEPRLRAEVSLSYQLFDTDQSAQRAAARWQERQLEISQRIERLNQVSRVADLFLELRGAEAAAARAEELAGRLDALRRARGATGSGELERAIAAARREAAEQRLRARNATTELKRLLKWPLEKPVKFELDESRWEEALRAAGLPELSALRRQLAEARAEQAKASIPERFRSEATLGAAVDLARALGVKAMGPLYAFNFFMTAGLFDAERGRVRNAALWAYARAVAEAEEVRREEEAEAKKAELELKSAGERLEPLRRAAAELESRAASLEAAFARGEVVLNDLLAVLKDLDRARAEVRALEREQTARRRDLLKFQGTYAAPTPPPVSAGDRLAETAGKVIGLAANPFELLLAPFRGAQDRTRLAEVKQEVLGSAGPSVRLKDPSLGRLFETARQRHPRFRQALAYEREREELLRAGKNARLPKFHLAYRYFSAVDPAGLNPQSFRDLFRAGEFTAGLGVSWTAFDPGGAARRRLDGLELEKADLQAAQVSSEIYLALAERLEMASRLNAARSPLRERLRNAEERLADLREFRRFNQDRDADEARVEFEAAGLRDELSALEARLSSLRVEIRRLSGLTDADVLELTDSFSVGDFARQIALERFGGLLQESLGRIRLSPAGRDLMTSASGGALEAEGLTQVLAARRLRVLAERGGDRAAVAQIDAVIADLERLRDGVMSWESRARGRRDAAAKLSSAAQSVPAAAADADFALLAELAVRLAEFRALATDVSADPAEQLSRLSELAVYLTALHASLSPETKWGLREGPVLGEMAGAWDKALLGRFDPFIAQRLAVKTAEAHQLRASLALSMEPVRLNINFITLFSSRDGFGPHVGPGVTSNLRREALTFVQIPPKLLEQAFWPLHKAIDAAGAGDVPVLGTILEQIVPGLRSRGDRRAAFQEATQSAAKELQRAKTLAERLRAARSAAQERHAAAVRWRDLAAARLEAFAAVTAPSMPTLEQSASARDSQRERQELLRQHREARDEALEAALALIALGLQPGGIASAPPARPDIGPAFASRLQELDRQIRQARAEWSRASRVYDAATVSLGLDRVSVVWTPRRSVSAPTEEPADAAPSAPDGAAAKLASLPARLQHAYSLWAEGDLMARFHGASAAPAGTPEALAARVQHVRYSRQAAAAAEELVRLAAELEALLGRDAGALLLASLTDPGRVEAARWEGSLATTASGDNAEAARLRELLRANRSERVDIALQRLAPLVKLDFQRNEFARVIEVQLTAYWRLIGSGAGARAGANAAERAILEKRLQQALYDAASAAVALREELLMSARALETVDAELAALGAEKGGDEAARIFRAARLSGERAYHLARLVSLHSRLRAELAAVAPNAPLPPLSQLLGLTGTAGTPWTTAGAPADASPLAPAEWSAARERSVRVSAQPAGAALSSARDRAALAAELLRTYRYAPDAGFTALLERVYARTGVALSGADADEDLPDALAGLTEPVFRRLHPDGGRLALKKFSLAFFYALELRDEMGQGRLTTETEQEAWLDARLRRDGGFLLAGRRERRGQLLSASDHAARLEWARLSAGTWRRFALANFPTSDQLAYVRAADAYLNALAPGLTGLLDLPEFADVSSSRLYGPVVAHALAHGLTPAQLADASRSLTPLSGAPDVVKLAARAEAERLRQWLRRLHELDVARSAEGVTAARRTALDEEVRRLKEKIEAEAQVERLDDALEALRRAPAKAGATRRFGWTGALTAGAASALIAAGLGLAFLAAPPAVWGALLPLSLAAARFAGSRALRAAALTVSGVLPALAAVWFLAVAPASAALARHRAGDAAGPASLDAFGLTVHRTPPEDRRLLTVEFGESGRPRLAGRTEVLALLPKAVLRSLLVHEAVHLDRGARPGAWGAFIDEAEAFAVQALALADWFAPAPTPAPADHVPSAALSESSVNGVRAALYLGENFALRLPFWGKRLLAPLAAWMKGGGEKATAAAVKAAEPTAQPTALERFAASLRGEGSLYDLPGRPESAGHALFIDARRARRVDGEWKVDRALGRAFYHQLKALQALADASDDDAPLPVRFDVLMDADLGGGLTAQQQAAVWNGLLADLGSLPGVRENLIRRLRRAPFQLTNLRGQGDPRATAKRLLARRAAEGYRQIQVVTGDLDFWRGIEVPQATVVLLVATVRDLVNVHVDVVFSGESAQLLRSYIERLPEGADILNEVSEGNDIRLKAQETLHPLEQLEDAEKQLRLFEIQA